jgi:hypothetical protein
MRERRSLKDFSTAELVIELIARITPRQTIPSPDIVVEDSQKTVMSQRQFCALVGIDRLTCEKLRKLGYIPYVGTNPIKIPVRLAREGLEQHIIDANAGQIGANARYKVKAP